MKKIIFVSHEATLTGAPILLLNILRYLREQLPHEFVVVLGKDGPIRSQFEELASVVIVPPPLAYSRLARGLKQVGMLDKYNEHRYREALTFKNVEVIFSNTIVNGEIVDRILNSSKVRVITYVHELAYTIQTFDQVGIKKALVQTNLFLAGSVAVQRNLLSMGVAADQVQVVPSSIPVAAITDKLATIDTASVRASLQLQQHDQLLVAIGTADWRKGNDLFIQMAARLAQRQPQVHFAWVGVSVGSLEQQRMSYEIQKYHLSERFHEVPVTPEYLKYIAAADIFVLPSREDPFPLVVLEAAAAGKPVVCFAETGGSPDFVGEENGTVVPYGDTTAMSVAIEVLLKDPIVRQRKGEHARAVVKQEYNIPQVAARIAQLLAPE